MILVLGCESGIENGVFDTARCEAFLIPANTGVELFATTLHYAPFHVQADGYRVACVLPKGTNEGAPAVTRQSTEDRWLFGANKWIATLPGTADAIGGIYVGLTGENISLEMIER